MVSGNTGVGALTAASIWGATAYGISGDAVLVALIPTLLGAFGRVGFEMARAADPVNHVKWSSVLYLFGGTLISSPSISVLGLVLLNMLPGTHSDPAAFFGLFFGGFVGPKILLWLIQNISPLVNKVTGIKLPSLGPQGDQQEPKP